MPAFSEFLPIILLSLQVSITAAIFAFIIGLPLAFYVALNPSRVDFFILAIGNSLLALPSVLVGLFIYLLLSKQGILGDLNLLFTPSAMIMAQFILTLPIVFVLSHRLITPLLNDYNEALKMDGATPFIIALEIAKMAKVALITVFLTSFGRAIAEVGAIMMVGGNISGYTRTMTTAIALETSKGDFTLAITLGVVLLMLSLIISTTMLMLGRDKK